MRRLRFLGLGALSVGAAWATRLLLGASRRPPYIPPVDDPGTQPPPGGADWPFVSVIVPSRNEERNLPRLLPTLLSQRYPRYEVIVVDDQSADATPEILRQWAERDSRLRIVHGRALPSGEGWKGKPHAMLQGVEAARGDWLLFTDADTRHEQNTLASTLAYALREKVDLLTIAPHFELCGVAEKLIMPIAYEGIMILYPWARVNDPASRSAIANGQFILIRRDVYEAVGGIARVKDQIAEDLEFGKAVKHDGYRLHLADGSHLVTVRMYTNLVEVWEGWSKNVVLSLKGNPREGFLAVQGTASLLFFPPLLLRWAYRSWHKARSSGRGEDRVAAAWITALALWNTAVPFAYRYRIDRMLGISPLWTLTQPVGAGLFALILLSSLYRLLTGRGVTWKGRRYAARGQNSASSASQR